MRKFTVRTFQDQAPDFRRRWLWSWQVRAELKWECLIERSPRVDLLHWKKIRTAVGNPSEENCFLSERFEENRPSYVVHKKMRTSC